MENERYTLLNVFDNNIWVPSCPVEILQGALIMDNLIGQNCLQIQLVSGSDKRLSSVLADVFCYDASAKPLMKEPVSVVFRDLAVSKGAYFGENETFYLRSGKVASVKCIISRVIYGDGTVWHQSAPPVEVAAPLFEDLDDQLKAVFQEQLKNSFYANPPREFKFIPKQDKNYWVCTCGRANENEQSTCQRCGMNRTWILQNLNVTNLRLTIDERLEAARREAEQERIAAAAAAQKALMEAEATKTIELPDSEETGEHQDTGRLLEKLDVGGEEKPERPPLLRYILLGVMGVALVGIGVLIYLLATDKLSLFA